MIICCYQLIVHSNSEKLFAVVAWKLVNFYFELNQVTRYINVKYITTNHPIRKSLFMLMEAPECCMKIDCSDHFCPVLQQFLFGILYLDLYKKKLINDREPL